PKLARQLPKTLQTGHIAALLAEAAKDETPKGLRMLAMLELMYSSGLRVSELVSLKRTALQIKDGNDAEFIPVFGKGNKERMVPVGTQAREALSKYLQSLRPTPEKEGIARDKFSIWLFPGNHGKPMTRHNFALLLKALALKANL